MRDRGIIYGGLALFLGLVTFPAWYNVAAGHSAAPPDVKLPSREKQCVAPAGYMRTSHMALLIAWREDVVRRNARSFTAFNGKTYNKSLTGTCLSGCHSNKAEFCDRCHGYVGVSGGPYCMDCHIDPKLVHRETMAAVHAAGSRP
jgi:[DsrC]-trisulfide reductase subunit J